MKIPSPNLTPYQTRAEARRYHEGVMSGRYDPPEVCEHGRPFGDGPRPDDCPDCDEHHGAELAEQSIGKEPGGA